MERLLESVSYMASEHAGETIVIDESYVDEQLSALAADEDLSQYIL
jgi:ATP-dependent HslUV protease ATP-binding subunit HslU